MPFGIGLPDIEERLNRIPGIGSVIETDEERRRKRRRQRPKPPRLAKKKDKDGSLRDLAERISGASALDLIGMTGAPVPKILKQVPKNINELAAGIIPAGGAVGRAVARDTRALVKPGPKLDRQDMSDFIRLATWATDDQKFEKRKRPKTDSEVAGLVAEMLRGWKHGVERAVPDPYDWEDIKRTARYWEEKPVFALLDVVPVGAAVTRPLSVARHATRIARQNPGLGVNRAVLAGAKESYRPGAARRAGLKGGIEPRIHRVKVGASVREAQGRPWSRIPAMRGFQRGYDRLFLTQGMKERRVGRAEERLAREERRQINLEAQELSAPVARVVYGRVGRLAGAFGLRSQMNPAERRRATAVAYAFQMPRHMDAEEALRAVQADLSEVLESGKMEVPRGGRVKLLDLTPEQRQALTTQIADLNSVREELRRGDISEDEFRGALEAMKQMTDRTQEMGLDIMQRRYGLDGDELDELLAAWGNRASMLPRRLAGRGHLGLDLADSPERIAWLAALTERLGPEQARASIAVSDAIARAIRPNDPASFYRDRVGEPSPEDAQAFTERVGDAAQYQRLTERQGSQALIEGAAEAPAASTAFFSPLQRYVDEQMPAKMQAGQLEAALLRQIPREEFHNAGLDNFFDQYGKSEVVLKADFQNFMANPLNAYNLREVHFVNTREAMEEGLDARYHWEHQGNYASRDPAEGEYHEVLFELPGVGRDKNYKGTGRMHWDRDNVAVHMRFHVFREDGKTKLLIEEIQSDWGNDFRKEATAGKEFRDLTPEERQEFDALRAEIEENTSLLRLRQTEIRELDEAIRNESPDAPPGANRDRYYAAMDEIDRIREEGFDLERHYDYLNDVFKLGNTPPPPLGRGVSARSSYLNPTVRWLTRYAAENGVDEIIVVSREAQLLRNARALDPRDWLNLKGGDAMDVTAFLAERPHQGRSYISYETDIPAVLAREMGVDGRKVNDAYEGQYRVPHDMEEQAAGRMPGTVFTVTAEAKARAMQPRSLYQRQPDWKGQPKGATELLGSQSAIRMFERGDVSTWIHELAHTAFFDLSDGDRLIVETHLMGGRRFDDWRDMDHERYARAFEDYVRKGMAPTKELASVFRKLSEWIKEIWQASKQRGISISPEVEQVFSRMFSPPDQGLTETWGYFPHRDFTELAQQQYRGGVRPPATGQTIGVPRLAGETVRRQPNELLLYQSGRLSPDPAQLVDVFLRRQRFQETLEARDELWATGQPMTTQPPRGAWLIRNPDEAAERIRPEARAAVEGGDTGLPLTRESLEELEGKLTGDADDLRKEMMARPGEYPDWASDMENVRWVPGEYVETRFGEVFEQRPRGSAWSALGLLNAMQRVTGIYGRPISYVGGNIPFNVMALMASAPVSTLRNAGRAIRIAKEDPALFRAIASETGETRASGGLPEFYVRANNRLQAAEQRATKGQRAAADVLSKAADTPFRVTAFLNNAAKRGFKSRDELWDLIRNEEHSLDISDVRQLTREQLLDFDALNPSGRRMASNVLYLWPFIYASIKWPAMFAREYPLRAAAAAELAEQKNENAPLAIANLWAEHGVDLGTLNPVGPLGDIAEQAQKLLENPAELDLTVLQERLSPTLAALVEGMSGGSKNALQNYLRQTVPGLAEIMSSDPRFRGGKQYADQSRGAYLAQRHGRFWPRGVNPQVIKERIEQFQKDQQSGTTHELEREADRKKIEGYINDLGGLSDEDLQALTQSYRGWWDYQEAVDEKKDATGQRKLTPVQTTEILHEIIEEHFPEVADELVSLDTIRASDDQAAVEEYAKQLKDYINAERTQLFDDYRSYASE